MILIIASLSFGCRGPVKEGNKNNALASSLSLHVGNEKYFIIDTKESVVAWTGSRVKGKHEGYVYISKGELMIENGQLMGGTVEIDMNKFEVPGCRWGSCSRTSSFRFVRRERGM